MSAAAFRRPPARTSDRRGTLPIFAAAHSPPMHRAADCGPDAIAALDRVLSSADARRMHGITPRDDDSMNSPQTLERARRLVLAHGWNATAYQIVNPGIDHWFSSKHEAVVGYVRRRGVRVVAGAPVCERAVLAAVVAAVVAEFEAEATAARERVCYFGAEARLESLCHDNPGCSMVLLGAQPSWHPAHWRGIIESRASMRAQLSRARNKHLRVEEWPGSRAAGNPDLERCLTEWLGTRGLPPLHFLVEPRTLERLADRRIFVASIDASVVGFLVASPVPRRNGWLVEQTIRGAKAPNGTSESLIDGAVRAMAADGSDYVTLGLAPLSTHGAGDEQHNPLWLRVMLAWVRAHGRRFYNFDGLDAFKTKFQPEAWEPVFAITNQRRFSFGILYALAEAFAAQSPLTFMGRGVARALFQHRNQGAGNSK